MLKLISSVASTAPTDDKSREAVIWHPAAVAVNTTNLNDPLGFGKIDVVNLRLVRMWGVLFSVNFTAGSESFRCELDACVWAARRSQQGARQRVEHCQRQVPSQHCIVW